MKVLKEERKNFKGNWYNTGLYDPESNIEKLKDELIAREFEDHGNFHAKEWREPEENLFILYDLYEESIKAKLYYEELTKID